MIFGDLNTPGLCRGWMVQVSKLPVRIQGYVWERLEDEMDPLVFKSLKEWWDGEEWQEKKPQKP